MAMVSLPSYTTIISIGAALDALYCISALALVGFSGERPRIRYHILLRLFVWGGMFAFFAAVHYWILSDSDPLVTTTAFTTTTIVVVLPCVIALWIYTRRDIVEGGPAPSVPELDDGAVLVITGSNAGIGKATVRTLANTTTAQNVTLYMLCRNVKKGEAAVKEIKKQIHNCRVKLKVLECDLSSFASVRKAATLLKTQSSSIDFLINNAGIMLNELQYSVDGNEEGLQANHLGHFLLTALLLPIVKNRVILLTSSTYCWAAPNFPYDSLHESLQQPPTYSMFSQYSATKWCNILHAIQLQQHYHMPAFAVHPGVVRSDVVRHMSTLLRVGNRVFGAFMRQIQKTPAQGAWGTLHAMQVAPGSPYCCWVNRQAHSLFVEPTVAQVQQVWDWSCETVGLTEDELEDLDKVRIDRGKPKQNTKYQAI